MLKSIDPLLNADVLHALQAMGHGDELVLCDCNFPADSVARATVLGKLLHIDNATAARAARAVLSLLPLDSFVEAPAARMEIVGRPDEIPPCRRRFRPRSTRPRAGPGPWAASSGSRSTSARARPTP